MSHLDGTNVSEYAFVPPAEVFEPHDVSEIQQIALAHNVAGSRPLRVVSTGYNWGLGSASSTSSDTDLISLNKLSSIRAIDEDLGYAVIDAGVTQEQLTQALHANASTRYLNCTASSALTSVVGNMMDRGVGLHGQRTDDLLGLEVVLPDGTIGTVGWWPGSGSLAANRWGLGPSSLHLFTQSNLGIVTAAAVRLRVRPSRREIVTFTILPGQMTTVVNTLRELVRDQVISGVTKIYDEESSALYGARESRIAIHACIDGPDEIVETKIKHLWRSLKDVEPERIPIEVVQSDPLMSAVTRLYHGDTGGSETIVRNALHTSTETADHEGSGWIFILPFVPLRGTDITRAIDIVRDGVIGTSVRGGTTVNVLDHDTVDLVIALSFNRDEASIAEAHAALDHIAAGLVSVGYAPYRVDTRHLRDDYADDGRSLDGALAERIKHQLDPSGVLAPTRYVPAVHAGAARKP